MKTCTPFRGLFLWVVAVLISAFVAPGWAATPFLEKTDLFESGKDGYALYRIPGVVVTKKGTVLAWCEARKNAKGDWGPIDTMLRRSTDGGKTWAPRQCIVHIEGELPVNPVAAAQKLDKPGDNTVDNPVAIADRESGSVHFLYCLEYMRCFYMRSDDDGVTWTKPVEITATFEQFAPIVKAKIPVLHIHGDADKVVPLEKNSRVICDRYRALGGQMELTVVPGKGHQHDPAFFESEAMLAFITKQGMGR